jgi:hypothetical protein
MTTPVNLLPTAVLVCALASEASAAPAPIALKPEEEAKLKVRLRLLEIDVKAYTEEYTRQTQRVISLKGAVKASERNNDRVGQYKQALQDALAAREEASTMLVELEKEKAKLLRQFGKKESDLAPRPPSKRQLLEKVLQQLGEIEKRLARRR